jgi:hypothetical protein
MGRLIIDLTGKRFGKLVVIKNNGIDSKSKKATWECLCDCGNTTIVRSDRIVSLKAKSCGCIKSSGTRSIKHGDWKSKLYRVWIGMRNRCANRNNADFISYGGRGITVCEEWNNYKTFKLWALNNGYADKLTIDRKNNNGNYEPSNCRWATPLEQANNKRNNCVLTYNGKTQTIVQWTNETGIKCQTIKDRINKYNWSIEKALTTIKK